MNIPRGKILNWVIFIAIIIVFFGALVFYQSQKINSTTEDKINKEMETKKPKGFAIPPLSTEDQAKADNQALNNALLGSDDCGEIKYDATKKQTCLDSLAYSTGIQKNDEKTCNKISDSTLKTKCLDQVYISLGISAADTTFCAKIKDSAIKQSCMDQIQVMLGKTAKAASDCNSIKDLTLKQSCLNNYYLSDSIAKLSKESCENIKDTDIKTSCTKTIEKNIAVINISKTQAAPTYKTAKESLKDCGKLSGAMASSCKDEANFKLAFEEKNISYCNAIKESGSKTKCTQIQSAGINSYYLRQAIIKKDSTLCGKILDSSLKVTCLADSK